jgi:hypothetical protein
MRYSSILGSSLVLFSLLLSSPAAAAGPDARALSDPTGWWWYTSLSPAALDGVLQSTGGRIIDLKVNSASPLTFSVALVANEGPYAEAWWWYYGLSEADLGQLLNQNQARILDLAPYEVSGATRFAAVLVPNTGADQKAWWWYYGAAPSDIAAALDANGGRLIDLNTYTIQGQRFWSAVMIANQGADQSGWWWYYGLNGDDLAGYLARNQARIYSFETYLESGQLRFAAILLPVTGGAARGWWWYYGQTESSLSDLVDQDGARIMDLERYEVGGQTRFAAVFLNNSNDLTTRIAGLLGYGSNGESGLYLKRVGGEVLASLNEKHVFEPASTIKALAHIHAMMKVQAGTASLNDMIDWCSVSSSVQDPPDGCPNAPCGEQVTLEWALQQMMWISDNRATDAVIRHFGRASIDATAQALGMVDTSINHTIGCGDDAVAHPDRLTLADIGLLYELAATTALDAGHRQTFYQLMAGKDTLDFTGVWGDMKKIIDEEGASLGLSSSLISSFKDQVRLSYKAGGYTLNNQDYISIGGWTSLPVCAGGLQVPRQYVFGYFIVKATGGSVNSRFFGPGGVGADIFREQIHSALSAFEAPCELVPVLFVRGDPNGDHILDLSDAISILGFLFTGGRAPSCKDAADVNDDGSLDISDAVALLGYLFLGGDLPAGTTPGRLQADPTPDRLGCDSYPQSTRG